VQNSSFSSQHEDVLSQLDKEPWLELILVMLYEYGCGDDSQWKAYFDILPSEFDTLMYWTPAELGQLQASAVVKKIGKESADALFKEKIIPLVVKEPGVFGFTSEVGEQEVLERAHRMASTIMAYAFDIEQQERDVDEEGYATEEEDADLEKGMVPLSDMLNADADRNNVSSISIPTLQWCFFYSGNYRTSTSDIQQARLFYEPASLVMKSVKPIQKGDEVFNDYGPLPRSDLLRRYGYVTENYAQYDVIEISIGLITEVATKECGGLSEVDVTKRVGYLEEIGALDDDTFDISSRGGAVDQEESDEERNNASAEDEHDVFPEALKLLILLLVLPQSEVSSLQPSSKGPKILLKRVERNELPADWFRLLTLVLTKRQREYETTISDDQKILRDLLAGVDKTSMAARRKLAALQVRLGEKEVLTGALSLLRSRENGEVRNGGAETKKRSADADGDVEMGETSSPVKKRR
jgi:SET domain-containing protein 6